ncbi:hypothetical protein SAMN05421664_1175 [Chryseobacterium soldanellicola]|uniref:Uncharacterized protein n=1 Tax=Chryseobacterium soldanellicola TaxID=311333 RepID=A0A1H1A071_9FLAO|nr:hypothetical protein [Chryseobacterium soldanellicola]SDQ33058.1 hypothetical protein SAMN05421664_1175 [Chryseobacterium soldanellicola]
MKNSETSMNCAEKKIQLIKDILENDCHDLKNNKSIDFDSEISREEIEREVMDMSTFASLAMPSSFFIEQIEPAFALNILANKYIHIYFIKNQDGISLLFRFNKEEQNSATEIVFTAKEKLLELKNGKLSDISPQNAKSFIETFKELYENQGFGTEETAYTQYITFHYKNILENFSGFEPNTQLICAAKPDPMTQKLRLNLILQIDREYCNKPITTEKTAFFNIGNMQP